MGTGGAAGSVLYLNSVSSAQLQNCSFDRNTADASLVSALGSSALTVSDSMFGASNQAQSLFAVSGSTSLTLQSVMWPASLPSVEYDLSCESGQNTLNVAGDTPLITPALTQCCGSCVLSLNATQICAGSGISC
jgi:hypothetical protein